MIKVSVLSSTFNRGKLLDRALATYANQTLDRRYWEYVLVDDGSQDNTLDVAQKWKDRGLPIQVYDVAKDLGRPKEPGKWRDGSIGRNIGSTMCHGKVLVATHPEILVPPDALEVAYESVCQYPNDWHTAIPYWMPENTDDVYGDEWELKPDLLRLRDIPGFPEWPKVNEICDYRNYNQERRRDWESEVWFAMSMKLWREIGGFTEFEVWGPVDVDFSNRRRVIGIPTRILTSLQSEATSGNLMVYHQWHTSPRDRDLCDEALNKHGWNYSDAHSALKSGGLFNIWKTGPRERLTVNHSVLGDHIDRYQFASQFSEGMIVLDLPCGTGYGANFIGNAYRYVGVDIDYESIEWAKFNHGGANREFYQLEAKDILVTGKNRFDRVFSFEGIEHIQEQEKFISDLFNILKSGGTFIISTPQKGVTPGTHWDKYMLTADELESLALGAGFVNLDWYHQRNYGGAPGMNPVTKGKPGKEDCIMVLGGQKPGDME